MNINRLKLVTLGMLAVGAITLWASGVKADQLIYSQPLQTPLADVGGFYQQAGSFPTADTFTLAQGASIDSLQWFGSYENSNTVGFPAANATDFILALGTCRNSDCLSNSEDVGDILINGDVPLPLMEFSPSMANETFLGTSSSVSIDGFIPSESSNYSYQVNFSPVQLSSGEYYLTIIAQLPNFDAGWSFDAGTGGDGISQGPDNFDLAFTLRGTPTSPMPEPASLLLLATGLALICLLALRARRLPLPLPVLVLLALAFLPAATRADTFTLDGALIDSLSFSTTQTLSGTTIKTFTVEMATTDAATYLTDVSLGTKIDLLTLDEFFTVDGTTTENVLEFLHDVALKDTSMPGSDISHVTFSYGRLTIMDDVGGSGGGNGTGVPEPSSAALLASGLLGLAGLGRKKLLNHGGKR